MTTEEIYNLPDGVADAIQRCWPNRPPCPPGMTYNVVRASSGGLILDAKIVVGIPSDLLATVVGTRAFGAPGTDIDTGLRGVRVHAREEGRRYSSTKYLRRGVVVVSEYLEVGEYSFLALPSWRLYHDATQYWHAAWLINNLFGLDNWIRAKRVDKVKAYEAVGITCEREDGTYDL